MNNSIHGLGVQRKTLRRTGVEYERNSVGNLVISSVGEPRKSENVRTKRGTPISARTCAGFMREDCELPDDKPPTSYYLATYVGMMLQLLQPRTALCALYVFYLTGTCACY